MITVHASGLDRKSCRLPDHVSGGYPIGIQSRWTHGPRVEGVWTALLPPIRRLLLLCRALRVSVQFLKALPRTRGTLAAIASDPKLATQVLERLRAVIHRLSDLAFSNGFADTDIHRDLQKTTTWLPTLIYQNSLVANVHVRLQEVRQADLLDQTLLCLKPVDGLFAMLKQLFQKVTADEILKLFT